jgi:hypothetical protein
MVKLENKISFVIEFVMNLTLKYWVLIFTYVSVHLVMKWYILLTLQKVLDVILHVVKHTHIPWLIIPQKNVTVMKKTSTLDTIVIVNWTAL